VELVSFLQWDQKNVPNVQEVNLKVVKVTIPVVVDTAINSFFLIKNITNKEKKNYGKNITRNEKIN
jgi:hypothetical protein|tara:strand:+ start:234 stop:431 length:198 start_codon:yes stop_codon:yes gene_type:complete